MNVFVYRYVSASAISSSWSFRDISSLSIDRYGVLTLHASDMRIDTTGV